MTSKQLDHINSVLQGVFGDKAPMATLDSDDGFITVDPFTISDDPVTISSVRGPVKVPGFEVTCGPDADTEFRSRCFDDAVRFLVLGIAKMRIDHELENIGIGEMIEQLTEADLLVAADKARNRRGDH